LRGEGLSAAGPRGSTATSEDGLSVAVATRLGELDLEVALDVQPGRCLALAGPSGAGKTSVLRTVAGLMRPRAGRVRCGHETWLDTDQRIWRDPDRRRCGYLFQDYALFPHLRAWQNVAYPLRGIRRAERRRRAVELLERFGVGHLAGVRPPTYSGGERQRVALARTLARAPHALVLDEPLSALDARARAGAGRELRSVLASAGVPTLLVTHDFTEAALLGDEIAVIDAGRILQRGTASELAAAPVSSFVADFTGAVVLSGTASPGPDGLTEIALDGGGTIFSTDAGAGQVAATVYPWEIGVERPGATPAGSPQNRLAARIDSITQIGNRLRVTVDAGQPLTAEITTPAARRLQLVEGDEAVAVWKASATRLVDL
jgi:molybdate transport system ATP-binding protein